MAMPVIVLRCVASIDVAVEDIDLGSMAYTVLTQKEVYDEAAP